MNTKMTIEIWSDIVCPFCYIGKRKFDQGIEQFEHRDNVEIIWHSYQLFPNYQQKQGSNFFEEVGKLKGISKEQSVQLHSQIAQYAKGAGLAYNFDNIAFPNTFMAHRFAHYAKEHNLQNEAEERLFAAYFTEGKNINDVDVLVQLGTEIGLDNEAVREVLNSSLFADEVKRDIEAAQALKISGFPYFLIDNKISLSGAQDTSSFLRMLNEAWRSRVKLEGSNIEAEKLDNPTSCNINGVCK